MSSDLTEDQWKDIELNHSRYRDEVEWAKANERQEYEELMSDYDALFKVADAANWARSLVSFDDVVERQLGPLRKALDALPKDIQEEIEKNEHQRTIARLSLAPKGSASRELLREDEVMEAWVAKAILRLEEHEALR